MSSSVGRNSLIMASGTAASRLTGQIRTILLAAALGTTGIAANAYQAGSMIPQVLYTLVSGGIFNAVLVPQIVRTLKEKDAQDRLNKLITVAIAMLLGVTALMAAATPLLTGLYVDGGEEMMALTSAFTLWCMPQILFYGLYTVIGQILAALDHFGTYAWSSVGANVISCAGFAAFIALFGRADQQPLDFWTPDKIMLTAGAWTLGVAFQALILFVPLLRAGFRYRPSWGLRGIGLRSMGPVAVWSIGVVIVNQVANIINTRITTSAPDQASLLYGASQFDVAGNATYQNAYTLFMLPYSLIAVSVSTAMFPRISQAIAERRIGDARTQLSAALRNVGLLMFFFSVAFLVMPMPITLALLPSVSVKEAILIAGPLMGLGCGLPLTAAYLIIQRTFYAFEDGRHPFVFAVMASGVQVLAVTLASHLLPPEYWVASLGASITIGNMVSFPLLIRMLRRRFGGRIDGRRLAATYGKGLLAAAVAVALGLVALRPIYALVGAQVGSDDGTMNWLQAVGACVLATIVITVAYVGMLWLLRTDELTSLIRMVSGRLHRGGAAAAEPDAADVSDAEPSDTPSSLDATETNAENVGDSPAVVLPAVGAEPADGDGDAGTAAEEPADGDHAAGPLGTGSPRPESPAVTTIPTARMAPAPQPALMPSHTGAEGSMRPQLGDTVLNRYVLVSSLRQERGIQAWKASDRALAHDCQLFIINDKLAVPQVNGTASTLVMSHNPYCPRVLQMRQHGDVAVVITQLDAGVSLADYLRGRTRNVLSYDAIRSIMGETVGAVIAMQREAIHHHALGLDTIRVTTNGVQIADMPVSSMLAEPVPAPPDLSPERHTVFQLAYVLYALLTRPRDPHAAAMPADLAGLPADTPHDLRVVCRRGLDLPDGGVHEPPLESLSECNMLLDDWSPLNKLGEHDIVLPSVDGEASIAEAPIISTAAEDALEIPADLAVGPHPNGFSFSMFGAAGDDEAAGTAGDAPHGHAGLAAGAAGAAAIAGGVAAGAGAAGAMGAVGAAKTGNQRKSLWSKGRELLNEGIDDGHDDTMTDQADLFDPFPDAQATADGSRVTLPINVASVRLGTPDADDDGDNQFEQTSRIPVIGADGSIVEPGAESQRALDEERAAIEAAERAGTNVVPPSFNPEQKPKRADDELDSVADQSLFGRFTTKTVAIVAVVVLIVAAAGIAVYSLTNDNDSPGVSQSGNGLWPEIDVDSVPFGDSNGDQNDTAQDDGQSDGTQSDGRNDGQADGQNQDDDTTDDASDDQNDADDGQDDAANDEPHEVVTADKKAGAVPAPVHTNTTPYQVASQTFLQSPGGQDGFAYVIRLTEPQDVYRMTVSITTSGGQGYVIANTTNDPSAGQQVAQFAFAEGGTTNVTFSEAVDTDTIMLWIPRDSLPGGQIYVNQIQLF